MKPAGGAANESKRALYTVDLVASNWTANHPKGRGQVRRSAPLNPSLEIVNPGRV